ncbi:MAG: hypothetical protein HY590_07810 [Candidatus Omnitrophica bacterium]|nr:hypothetical protein [Candidatus Omnitrophota bacterium]
MKRLKLLLFIFILFFLSSVAKDLFFQFLFGNGIAQVTGLRTSIAAFHLSLLSSHAEAKEILLYNPKGFEDPIFARISDFFFELDLAALLRGDFHLSESQFVLEELFLVKNREGVTNVSRLRASLSQRDNREPVRLQIDQLDFAVLRIICKNYQTTPPTVRAFHPEIHDEHLEGLRGSQETVHAILKETFAHPRVSPHVTDFGDLQEKR